MNPGRGEGVNFAYERVGMLGANFELTPAKGDQSWRGLDFLTLKETILKTYYNR